MILDDLKHHHAYDCADIGEGGFVNSWGSGGGRGSAQLRLFGNANVGSLELTNLQIAGQMGSDQTFIVQRWYARHNFPDNLHDHIRAWANSVVATFVVGTRPIWQRSLYELFERRPRTNEDDVVPRVASDPFPQVIPPRQGFHVNLDQFGWNIDALTPHLVRDGSFRPRVWVHLEGVLLIESTPASITTIVKSLLVQQRQRETVEEEIARWLGGQIEDAKPEAQGQLHAVRDGILEGRHRS
jgi:hypothetical protein